jgi:hypothetical protein
VPSVCDRSRNARSRNFDTAPDQSVPPPQLTSGTRLPHSGRSGDEEPRTSSPTRAVTGMKKKRNLLPKAGTTRRIAPPRDDRGVNPPLLLGERARPGRRARWLSRTPLRRRRARPPSGSRARRTSLIGRREVAALVGLGRDAEQHGWPLALRACARHQDGEYDGGDHDHQDLHPFDVISATCDDKPALRRGACRRGSASAISPET